MNVFANAEHNRLLNAAGGNAGYALMDACEQIAALTDQVDALKARAEKAEAALRKAREALHHIAHQKPVSDVALDWHEEWRHLRTEAKAALDAAGGEK